MSIIYDALKKAEREREPLSPELSAYRSVRAARRRWRRVVVTSMLVGATTLGAVSAWRWLWPLGVVPTVSVTAPRPVSLSVNVPDGEDRAAQQAGVSEPAPVTKSPAVLPGSRSEKIEFPGAPVALVSQAHTTAEASFGKAMEAESKGQWEQAVQYYHQAIALNPTLVEARNNLGNLYVRQQQMTAAITAFQAALALNPNYAIARNNLGSAFLLVGEEELAIQEFLAALLIDRTYVSPYYNLAALYARRGDVRQSVVFLTKALAIEPAVLSWLQEDADFDRIRAAPEFQRLRAQSHAGR